MMHKTAFVMALGVMLGTSGATFAQGTTQTRDGLGSGSHPDKPNAAQPAGSVNAATGPQAHPAYPSGSTTANPGAAFVKLTPKPATGAVSHSPGSLSTTTVKPGGATVAHPGAAGVGEAATPPK